MRIFNLNIYLTAFSILFLISSTALHFLALWIQKNSLDVLQKIAPFLSQASQVLSSLYSCLLVWLVILIVIEIALRLGKDSVFNSFKSVWHTFGFRHFLAQTEKSEKTAELQEVKKFNPIHSTFNKAVRKCVIDIRTEKIMVCLKVPHTQQAQKILKDMEAHIKEELSSRNPNYYFSAPERIRHNLWFIGTKRK
ncbi:hypothetical protein NGA79_00675 [Lactococcus garvieae]|uniref:hypothetical protein n=1 Tax=Lactococcus garvieae TaxID=1363 RepID=UPI0020CB8D98|nr:hypothetical protein [Lactococcus garvieae]MDG6190533.1 hypothetical protein [Lactococcus garvieae]